MAHLYEYTHIHKSKASFNVYDHHLNCKWSSSPKCLFASLSFCTNAHILLSFAFKDTYFCMLYCCLFHALFCAHTTIIYWSLVLQSVYKQSFEDNSLPCTTRLRCSHIVQSLKYASLEILLTRDIFGLLCSSHLIRKSSQKNILSKLLTYLSLLLLLPLLLSVSASKCVEYTYLLLLLL